MTSNYHTPITAGAVANAATVENPLAELDEAISNLALTEKDGHIIQDEGVDLAQQQRLNFVGGGVTVTNSAGVTLVSISGAANAELTAFANGGTSTHTAVDAHLAAAAPHSGHAVTGHDQAVTLAQSTYTPTLGTTAAVNVAASTAVACYYTRVGDLVTVMGFVSIDATAAANTTLSISLPIASDISNSRDGVGFAGNLAGTEFATIQGDGTNNNVFMRFTALTLTNQQWQIHFVYRVV
jgi:hypothetical protein